MDKKLYIETYGCQMNFSDSEIVASVMQKDGYQLATEPKDSQVILINTCSIRDNAEQRVFKRLKEIAKIKKNNPQIIVGIIGCMAERLKEKLFEQEVVDVVVGPDAYRDISKLIAELGGGQKAANVILSTEETYDDIEPIRYASNGVSAFISIMRGCQNLCAYCIVPFTRGKERSRHPKTIVDEARKLFHQGYREITLLGQNVNSYYWRENELHVDFPKLLEEVALIDPLLRVRFTTSHPKDISDELLYVIAKHDNICKSIHLAMQSGSTRILKLMRRKYTREWYMERISAIKHIIPECGISTDIIAGFCGETEEDHQDTLSLMEWVHYDYAFMFKYSEREGTIAARDYADDVPEEIKGRRLQEIIDLQQRCSKENNQKDIHKIHQVLAEGFSKKSADFLSGRNSQNKMVVFPKGNFKPGDYVNVRVTSATAATLIGELVE